jgi:hypothetical protein
MPVSACEANGHTQCRLAFPSSSALDFFAFATEHLCAPSLRQQAETSARAVKRQRGSRGPAPNSETNENST